MKKLPSPVSVFAPLAPCFPGTMRTSLAVWCLKDTDIDEAHTRMGCKQSNSLFDERIRTMPVGEERRLL